jgi:hypothetical protein
MRKLLIFIGVLTMACGDSPTEVQASVAGTWELSTVNGANLPYVITQSGADKIELTADVITATSTGSFTQQTTIKTTQNSQVTTQTLPDAGSYVMNGTAVTFTFNSDGSSGTGSLSGDTMTVTDGGFALVYKRK